MTTMYEHSIPHQIPSIHHHPISHSHSHSEMQDWARNEPGPSPTYSNDYPIQTYYVQPSTHDQIPSAHPHHSMRAHHPPPPQQQQQQQYYYPTSSTSASLPPSQHIPGGPSPGEYDVFSTPIPHNRRPPHSHEYDGAGNQNVGSLLTTTSLNHARTYDSTIPQYYPVTTERPVVRSTQPGTEGKRKRKTKPTSTATADSTVTGTITGETPIKTPKRGSNQIKPSPGSSTRGNSKRMKVDTGNSSLSTNGSLTTSASLPTPPSTGSQIVERVPNQMPVPTAMPFMMGMGMDSHHGSYLHQQQQLYSQQSNMEIDAASGSGLSGEWDPELNNDQEEKPRGGVSITTHSSEGRKLALGGGAPSSNSERGSPPLTIDKPERRTPVPAVLTNESGHASLSTDLVLESELLWLENRASPPSSPIVQTPILEATMIAGSSETPPTPAEKAAKRLSAFTFSSTLPGINDDHEGIHEGTEPMVCTRIDMFGRVAVRKDIAIKFLGLDDSATSVVEEGVPQDEEGLFSNTIFASGGSTSSSSTLSSTSTKPSWPTSAPWSLAGGSRKEKIQREKLEKANLLRRYLDSSDDSDEEFFALPASRVYGKGKGKSIAFSNPIETHASDAKSALLNTLRNRPIPVMPSGVVACVCGATSPLGLGSMIPCASCKTWHHLMCNNLSDDSIGPRWWCPSCENHVMALSTPARTTPAYAQSEERSSAFKGELTLALAPSPSFMHSRHFAAPPHALHSSSLHSHSHSHSHLSNVQTPLSRNISSPGRPIRSNRILSYGDGLWAGFDHDQNPSGSGSGGIGNIQTPTTPAPNHDRFSTPRIDDIPFDVTSTPSRHLDFNFGQPSLFSLTPLGGGLGARNRLPPSTMMDTPLTLRARMSESAQSSVPSRHDFLRDLGKSNSGSGSGNPGTPTHPTFENAQSPTMSKWPHALLGHGHHPHPSPGGERGEKSNLSPSPFGHRRSLSSSKFGAQGGHGSRNRSGLGLGLPLDASGSSGDDR